ncbi:MAG TPA: PA2169 family four-helix-bundle protein [Rhodopseudomonas sp.]|uniref:ferritin-like domain-containing protein n=1 Tax=Rhodopseudomonas sp. TaxID=1078 RepID=UPI002EDA15F8
MDKDLLDHLKTLHTAAIDARNGYQEALEDAEGHGLTGLFNEMIALHEGNARELAAELSKAGETPDDDGSFMSIIHRTIMNVRSLFNGLDGSVLPGLIDGEKRNVSKYDDALQATTAPTSITALLTTQRSKIQQKIAKMEVEQAEYKNASAST